MKYQISIYKAKIFQQNFENKKCFDFEVKKNRYIQYTLLVYLSSLNFKIIAT